jgi:hypothetical protein
MDTYVSPHTLPENYDGLVYHTRSAGTKVSADAPGVPLFFFGGGGGGGGGLGGHPVF